MLLLLWCSNCTWKEVRHGGHDLDREHVNVVDDAKGLLLVPVRDCSVVVCVSRLPLPPLSDRVLVIVTAAVLFWLHLREGHHGGNDVDVGRVNIIDVDKVLLGITNKHTNKQKYVRL